ncbi:MAG: amino acid ABC transporter substrate-binding protein [Actinomadura rubrobrunea]|nr:amino acid ABC transporter substrate-binding protein [Actinomadura rubrobrunea]
MSGASRRRPVLGAVLAALALAAGACGGEGATVQGVNLVEKGRLTSCTHVPNPPFQMRRGGAVVGFDVDLIDLVARRLGVTQRVVDVPFSTMDSGEALHANRCDVVMGALTITPERAEAMTPSKPYLDDVQALVVKKGRRIRSLDDVAARNLRLGAQTAGSGQRYAEQHDVDPRLFDTSEDLLEGLRAGRVDAVVQDYPVVQGWLRSPAGSGLRIAALLRTGEQYGFWVRRNHDFRLVELINEAIDQARADGTYRRLYEKWIGPMPKAGGGAARARVRPVDGVR